MNYKHNIIKNMIKEGYNIEQVKNALCDGMFLEDENIPQEEAEDAYNEIVYNENF